MKCQKGTLQYAPLGHMKVAWGAQLGDQLTGCVVLSGTGEDKRAACGVCSSIRVKAGVPWPLVLSVRHRCPAPAAHARAVNNGHHRLSLQ